MKFNDQNHASVWRFLGVLHHYDYLACLHKAFGVFFFHLAVFVFFHGTNVNSRRYNITLFLLNVHCKVLEIFHSNVGWGKWAKVTHPGYGFRPDERRRIVSSGFFSLPRSTSGDQPTLKDVNSPRQFRPCFKISMSKKDIFELRGNEDMKLRSQYCTQLKQLWKESLSTSGLNGIWTMISAIPLQCSTRNVLSSQLRAWPLTLFISCLLDLAFAMFTSFGQTWSMFWDAHCAIQTRF